MASGKRQPSKRKRSSQNRQQRAALQVRKEAAQAPPVVRPAPTPKAEPVVERAPAEPKTSLLGRLRGPTNVNLPPAATGAKPAAAARPANARPTVADAARAGRDRAVSNQASKATGRTTPSRTATSRTTTSATKAPRGSVRAARREGANRRASLQPVGYRAALSGLLAAAAALVLCFLQATPVDHSGHLYSSDRLVAQWAVPALDAAEHIPDPTPDKVVKAITPAEWATGRSSERLIQAFWPFSAAVVLPMLGAFLAFQSVRRRRPARVVTRAMYATLLGAFITMSLFIFFLPAVIAVTVASYQVRKAENQELAAARAEAAGDGPDGDVIDADIVDD
jgi:hypothetical protein